MKTKAPGSETSPTVRLDDAALLAVCGGGKAKAATTQPAKATYLVVAMQEAFITSF